MPSVVRPVRPVRTDRPAIPGDPLPRIVRLPEVCRLVGLSRSSVLRLCNRGDFAPKFNLGLHAVGWYEADVLAWIQARAGAAAARIPTGNAQ